MNSQILVIFIVAALAKEILTATTPVTTNRNVLNTRVRGQRQFGFFSELGQGFGTAAKDTGLGFGGAVKGIGEAVGSAIHGPGTVVHAKEITNSVSVAINNAEHGTAISSSAAQKNQNNLS